MFRAWLAVGSGFVFTAISSHADVIGVAGDSFDMSNPAYVTKLETSGHTFREINSIDAASLQGLTALWLDGFSAFAFSGIDLSSPDLTSFVNNGGKLIVQSPGFGLESVTDYPFASNLSVATAADENTIHIVNPGIWLGHVSDQQLSGWTQASTSGYFDQIGDWQGLANNGTDGQWVSIGKQVGQGSAIYTFQDMSRMMFEPKSDDAIAMLNSIVPASVPEPSAIALVLLGAPAFLLARRRR